MRPRLTFVEAMPVVWLLSGHVEHPSKDWADELRYVFPGHGLAALERMRLG